MEARGSLRRFRPFTVEAPVLKTSTPSLSTSNQTGARCGRPSGRTVANFAVRGGGAVGKASSAWSATERSAISRSPGGAAVGGVHLGPGLDHRSEGGRVVRVLLV